MGRPTNRTGQPDINNASSWYTRGEAAHVLGCSRTKVARLDGRFLHPVEVDGCWRYEPGEVMAHKARANPQRKRAPTPSVRSPGELAAAACKLLEGGATRNELVLSLCIDYDQAQKLWDQWRIGFEDADHERRETERAAALRRAEEQREAERAEARAQRVARIKALTGGVPPIPVMPEKPRRRRGPDKP